MTKKNLKVKSFITEKKISLNQSIRYAIKHKERLHITAPVGSRKTTLAIEFIANNKDKYQFLLLEPQISISSQVKIKLEALDALPFEYNSKTFKKLERWERDTGELWSNPYISTIDSAWRLFEDGRLNPDRTVVFFDETHTLLQDARKGFDKTVNAILVSGCPVIGLSATESSWVLQFVLKFDRLINIEATEMPTKAITPFIVSGIASSIAQVIEINSLNKVVIFTKTIKQQENIEEAILELMPKKKVIVWNRERRDHSEKASWKHLMEKDELPPGTNVAIINKVAQAGVNINDKDIDLVMLVDQFDPLGFLQYLGRCRFYSGEFDFLHKDFGKMEADWQNPQEIESYLKLIEKGLTNFRDTDISTLRKSDESFRELYSKISGKYVLNRCVAARRVYDQFNELHGTELLKFLKVVAPSLVINEYHTYTGIKQVDNSITKAAYRANKRSKLPELVRKSAAYLVDMIPFLKPEWSHEVAYTLIDESCHIKSQAKSDGVLYVPNTRKKTLRKTIKTSKQAGDTHLARVLLAARQYRNNKRDSVRLNAVMKESMNDIKQHFNAYAFFYHDYPNEPLYKTVLDDLLNSEKGNYNTVDDWKKIIQSKLPSALGMESIAKLIYESCVITTKKRIYVNGGIRRFRYRLDDVVYTYDEYLKAKGLDQIF